MPQLTRYALHFTNQHGLTQVFRYSTRFDAHEAAAQLIEGTFSIAPDGVRADLFLGPMLIISYGEDSD